jgi:hypothetical protein
MSGRANRPYFSLSEPTAEKMSAFKREEVTGAWKNIILKTLQLAAHSSSNIVLVKKPGKVKWIWSMQHRINKKSMQNFGCKTSKKEITADR